MKFFLHYREAISKYSFGRQGIQLFTLNITMALSFDF
jgi:hypothetical protein